MTIIAMTLLAKATIGVLLLLAAVYGFMCYLDYTTNH